MFNRNKNFQAGSGTDITSLSDSDSTAVSPITSTDNSADSLKENCCLICSILPTLSNVNCCPKHLKLLSKTLPSLYPSPVVYMMRPTDKNWPKLECYYSSNCSKSKRRHLSPSSSSSSSSSSSQRRQKKRSVVVQSSVRIILNSEEREY